MLLIIFKALKNSMPQYIQSLFNIRDNKKNLRGNNKLVLPVAKTTTYGLKSTSYIAAKAWIVFFFLGISAFVIARGPISLIFNLV